jgi:hypothetical protein
MSKLHRPCAWCSIVSLQDIVDIHSSFLSFPFGSAARLCGARRPGSGSGSDLGLAEAISPARMIRMTLMLMCWNVNV